MIKIEILQNSRAIRESFMKKFLLTWEEFQIEYRDILDKMKEKNHKIRFEEVLMWDKMSKAYQNPTFAEALTLLKSLQDEVCFLAEPNQALCIGEETHQNFVAKTNAIELAELIEYDWYESWKAEEYFYIDILPPDLYVFDAKMEHLLVFTHENDSWDLEWTEPLKAAAARVCIAYGFS